ncbi:glycosyltransferase family 4 protein [Desulfovibrio sp. ZJ200]|uniref:glycosyltransferase family 4 protein n=1 Tax=Desulfovibrio sp. ZJ200 TaxID=2709792 RepID=UPI0013EC0175|nr:glycosyltransferase family 4 protein [Desulfovibrio sp. ZJ200]
MHECNGLLVSNMDAPSLAEALARLMRNENLRLQYGSAAREGISAYNRERILDQWDELFTDASSRKGHTVLDKVYANLPQEQYERELCCLVGTRMDAGESNCKSEVSCLLSFTDSAGCPNSTPAQDNFGGQIMRIGMLIFALCADKGGAERAAVNIACGFTQKGHACTLFYAARAGSMPAYDIPDAVACVNLGIFSPSMIWLEHARAAVLGNVLMRFLYSIQPLSEETMLYCVMDCIFRLSGRNTMIHKLLKLNSGVAPNGLRIWLQVMPL